VREKCTAKNPLPGITLPCGRCHASTHGKAFAVRFEPFAVPFARTTKTTIPVVIPDLREITYFEINFNLQF
jgi:hypothetical protein